MAEYPLPQKIMHATEEYFHMVALYTNYKQKYILSTWTKALQL